MYIKQLGLSMFMSICLYHMLCVSKVQFVAQLRAPPRKLAGVETKALRAILGGPGNRYTKDAVFTLKDESAFPI